MGALGIDDRLLSVCPVPDPKWRMEGLNKLKIGTNEAMTWVTHNPI